MDGRIDAAGLKARIDQAEELAILDVREAGQYAAGHLFFATHIPYSRLELEVCDFVPRMAVEVIVYDDGDGVAARAADALGRLGYTQIRALEGGAPAWAAAGYTLYEGVNLPSKTFGELVEHELDTPRISADELAEMHKSGGDFIILDGRTPEEYVRFNIPGGISCPNADLPLRFDDLVPTRETTVVINCAGRTRSIIGAQTLINFGIANRVVALENGTQGWALAGRELETGAGRIPARAVMPASMARAKERAAKTAETYNVSFVDSQTLYAWQNDDARTTFVLDVRSHDEFRTGHLPGSRSAPGGQLVQATDRWIGVRGARVVVCDDTEVRAICTAHWLGQMGWDVHVLKEGIGADDLERGEDSASAAAVPNDPLTKISVDDLRAGLGDGDLAVIDLRASADFRDGHVPGAVWAVRPRVAEALSEGCGAVCVVADDEREAALAAADLRTAGAVTVSILAGGFEAWVAEGHAVERSSDVPSESNRIDFVAFTAERHGGNQDHMRRYLEWEIGLIDQLDAQERAVFNIPAAAP